MKNTFLDYGYSAEEIENRVNDTFYAIFEGINRFYFEGFLPQKKGRQTRMQQLSQQAHTMIIYESPFRLVKTLEQLSEYLGADRKASVSREISKVHEDTQRGTLMELVEHYKEVPPKGEIVIIVAGKDS